VFLGLPAPGVPTILHPPAAPTKVEHLIGNPADVPGNQLWDAVPGPTMQGTEIPPARAGHMRTVGPGPFGMI
jgi:hypothetical protein